MLSVKTQIRQAALAALDGVTTGLLGVYGARVLEDEDFPAVLVSVALERNDTPGTTDSQALLATLALRVVGKASTDPDRTTTVVDDLEVVEQAIHDRLAWDQGGDDPLGLGVTDLYLDSVDEPEVDDEHEVPVAIIQVVYGIMFRVDRATLSVIK